MSMFERKFAPVSSTALSEIDAQAARTLRALLSSRNFADVKGPMGWDFSAVSAGRLRGLPDRGDGICAGVREVSPLVESRVNFEICLFELQCVDRGAKDPDLTAVERAAKAAAEFEENVVYDGCESAGIKGLLQSCANKPADVPTANPDEFIAAIAGVVRNMKVRDSICGPYALAGGAKLRASLGKIVHGRTLLDILKDAAGIAEFICTPLRDEVFLVSMRGGDFELTLGADYTVGYAGAGEKLLKFFLTESFTFRVLEPRAYAPISLK